MRDAELHAGHPQGVLVVAQAADPVLHVGLLVEDRVPELRPAPRLVLEALGDVGLGRLACIKISVRLVERVVQDGRSRHEPRLEKRRLCHHFLPRLDKDLVDRARGMPHLEPAVPKDVEDLLRQVLGLGRHRRGPRLGREKEHDVDVAPGRQLAPPVAAQRDQGHLGRRLAQLRRVCGRSVIEEPLEQQVHHLRTGPDDLKPGRAGLVARAQVLRLLPEELLAGGQPLGGGTAGVETEGVPGALFKGFDHRSGYSVRALPEAQTFAIVGQFARLAAVRAVRVWAMRA